MIGAIYDEDELASYPTFYVPFVDLQEELQRAVTKHKLHQTPLNSDMTDGEILRIIMEEVGEVATASTYDRGSYDEFKKELLQVAAMAYAAYIGVSNRASRSLQGERRVKGTASLDWEDHSRSRRSPAGAED